MASSSLLLRTSRALARPVVSRLSTTTSSSGASRQFSRFLPPAHGTVQQLNGGGVSSTLVREFHMSRPALGLMPFKLADIGEGIAEVEVIEWFIKEGDTIRQYDKVCEVQSDKATVEITSRYDGVVKTIHYKTGEMAAVGTALIDIEVEGMDAPVAAPKVGVPSNAPPPEVTPAAATPVVATPSTPTPSRVEGRAGGDYYGVEDDYGERRPLRTVQQAQGANDRSGEGGKSLATPSVRRLAKEHNISLSDVTPTGKGYRVLKSDLLEHIKTLAQGKVSPAATAAAASVRASAGVSVATPSLASAAAAAVSGGVAGGEARAVALTEDVVVPVRGIQRIMVSSMTDSWTVPHFGYADEIVMDEMVALRESLKPVAARYGLKLSYMPIMIKAASLALRRYPQLNAHYDVGEGTVTQRASHNIGVAMDTPKGLLVPVVKDVQNKSLFDIAADMGDLMAKGAEGRLTEHDLTGGTFSLSNIGAIGGTYMSPVIPRPTVAIGALGRLQKVPRFNAAGEVVPVTVMASSWSGDHRVVDGATMARFVTEWKNYLENPTTMVGEMQ